MEMQIKTNGTKTSQPTKFDPRTVNVRGNVLRMCPVYRDLSLLAGFICWEVEATVRSNATEWLTPHLLSNGNKTLLMWVDT
jgi:hypothetical protein